MKTKEEDKVLDKEYLRDVPDSLREKIMVDANVTLILYTDGRDSYGFGGFCPTTPEKNETYFVHSCKEGNGKVQKITGRLYDYSCKYCNSQLYSNHIFDKDSGLTPHKIKKNDVIAFSVNEETNTVIAQNVVCEYSAARDEEGMPWVQPELSVKAALEITPGVSVLGYKVLKRSIKKAPAFEVMNINSQTINSGWARQSVYDNCIDAFDFLRKNSIFAERTGIKEALKMLPDDMLSLNSEAFILLHMCMIAEYPILELLIKSGYTKLYYELVTKFIRSQNKSDILKNVKEFQSLFNISSKGSSCLRIPNYIGEYLKQKAAPLSEYRLWCDIYELQPLSKEQFQNYINSFEFIVLQKDKTLVYLPSILKYDYKIEQVSRYLHKQKVLEIKQIRESNSHYYGSRTQSVRNMADYLTMCEYAGITPKKFPSNINQAHDEVMKLRTSAVAKIDYSKMASIGMTTQKLLSSFVDPKKLTKMEEQYTIVVPVSENDFIQEGLMQNSCVGHYAKKVNDGERIVFFVREKDTPNESFITAEYVCETGQLGQCMYSNNREVTDDDLLNYCKVACNRIRTGLLTGQIY